MSKQTLFTCGNAIRIPYKGGVLRYCKVKGHWITPKDCETCSDWVYHDKDGNIISGQKRLIDYIKPKN